MAVCLFIIIARNEKKRNLSLKGENFYLNPVWQDFSCYLLAGFTFKSSDIILNSG
jgi:hypothetical protein